MKEGEKFVCRACGETAFAKKETVFDGWTAKGSRLICPYCGAAAESGESGAERMDGGARDADALNRLRSLLGESNDGAPVADWKEDETHFCRDCAHAAINVFRVVCTKTGREVDPMDDCAAYARREEKGEAFSS